MSEKLEEIVKLKVIPWKVLDEVGPYNIARALGVAAAAPYKAWKEGRDYKPRRKKAMQANFECSPILEAYKNAGRITMYILKRLGFQTTDDTILFQTALDDVKDTILHIKAENIKSNPDSYILGYCMNVLRNRLRLFANLHLVDKRWQPDVEDQGEEDECDIG